MSDIDEVLDDLISFLDENYPMYEEMYEWVAQKRSEYAAPKGDCCG